MAFQLGLATSRGNEILAHFMWAAHLNNEGTLLTDFNSAFNEVKGMERKACCARSLSAYP